MGISKRGNGDLRHLLVQATRALERHAKTRDDRLGTRLRGLKARAHPNVATVALAAKLARWYGRCWPGKEAFRPGAA